MLVQNNNGDESGSGEQARKPRPDEAPAQDAKAAEGNPPESASADKSKSQLIGDALKTVYRHTLEEDIPGDFLDLLKQLK
ncbi:NepR family anti-sigma factor [Blastomonas sp.]|uniref:NepR family anti-sigma factor n=1 Tax=Blastomonas sp. TaxID=1909299 RepID=UPI003593BAC1